MPVKVHKALGYGVGLNNIRYDEAGGPIKKPLSKVLDDLDDLNIEDFFFEFYDNNIENQLRFLVDNPSRMDEFHIQKPELHELIRPVGNIDGVLKAVIFQPPAFAKNWYRVDDPIDYYERPDLAERYLDEYVKFIHEALYPYSLHEPHELVPSIVQFFVDKIGVFEDGVSLMPMIAKWWG